MIRARHGTSTLGLAALRFVAALAAVVSIGGCSSVQLRSPIAAASGPPSTFSPTTSDRRATRVLDVRDGLTKAAAFRAASDALAEVNTVDVSDARAGFLMTPWQASLVRDGVPDLRYRTRIVLRFLGDDWKQLSIRAEANWQRGDEWDVGYDSKVLDDVTAALQTKMGKKP